MIVNWGNVINSIQAGRQALDVSNVGAPINDSVVDFSDNPMGDFDVAAEDYFVSHDNSFMMNFDKWGSQTAVVIK